MVGASPVSYHEDFFVLKSVVCIMPDSSFSKNGWGVVLFYFLGLSTPVAILSSL